MNNENKTQKNESTKKIRSNKGIFLVFSVIFLALVAFLSLYGFIAPDRDFSENENRVLEKAPVLTVQTLLDGSFMKKCETYLTDQFPFRDQAIYVKSYVDRLVGKREENGAYIGKNGFIFDKQSQYDKDKMTSLAELINSFCNQNPELNTVFALSPNSSYIYSENLPDYLSIDSQKESIEHFTSLLTGEINTVDTINALNKAKEDYQVFYRTDHHWTTRGAYSVFEQIAKALSLETEKVNYEFHNVANGFKGTLSGKVMSLGSSDSVEVCFPSASQGTFFIDFYGEKEKSASFFFEEKLSEKNKYEVFLGGNYGKALITTNLESDRKLVVIKDSYANCLLPMLTPYFSKILVLDPRYMTESVEAIMQQDSFTDLLFIYNANTLYQDISLKTVLE